MALLIEGIDHTLIISFSSASNTSRWLRMLQIPIIQIKKDSKCLLFTFFFTNQNISLFIPQVTTSLYFVITERGENAKKKKH